MPSFAPAARITRSATSPQRCRDPKDDYLLELARVADADILVTGDSDLTFIGFRDNLKIDYHFPAPLQEKPCVFDAIRTLQDSAVSMGERLIINAHEYWVGGYSYIYMSRNRVLDWNQPSYTIQASGRQTSIHPMAPKMEKVMKDVFRFIPGHENQYRRLTARECARIQTFPDTFEFKYQNLNDAYKMIGNAVPVKLAYHIAISIHDTFRQQAKRLPKGFSLPAD